MNKKHEQGINRTTQGRPANTHTNAKKSEGTETEGRLLDCGLNKRDIVQNTKNE